MKRDRERLAAEGKIAEGIALANRQAEIISKIKQLEREKEGVE